MPIVIFHERGEALYAYIAKQDLEARVLQVEHDETDRWGGAIALEGGVATTSIRSRGGRSSR